MRNIDLFHTLIDIAALVKNSDAAGIFQQPFQRVLKHLTSVIVSTKDGELFDLLTESLELFLRLSLIDDALHQELIQKLNAQKIIPQSDVVTVLPSPMAYCEDDDTAFDQIAPESTTMFQEIEPELDDDDCDDDDDSIDVNDLAEKDWIDIKDLDVSKIYITNPEIIRIFNELKAKRA